jgi:hypothetical protein
MPRLLFPVLVVVPSRLDSTLPCAKSSQSTFSMLSKEERSKFFPMIRTLRKRNQFGHPLIFLLRLSFKPLILVSSWHLMSKSPSMEEELLQEWTCATTVITPTHHLSTPIHQMKSPDFLPSRQLSALPHLMFQALLLPQLTVSRDSDLITSRVSVLMSRCLMILS